MDSPARSAPARRESASHVAFRRDWSIGVSSWVGSIAVSGGSSAVTGGSSDAMSGCIETTGCSIGMSV